MRIAKTITQLLVTILGVALCSASMLVLMAHDTSTGTVRAVDLAADRATFNPVATLDTTQVDDTRALSDTGMERADADAEGQDVLILTYDDAPPDLWNALSGQHPRWYDEPLGSEAGHGTFYVPVGTTIPVDDGLYRATLDGWSSCTDGVTLDGECSATGPVVPVPGLS
jgi:hypothetical protein